jgi:hypothetical protein
LALTYFKKTKDLTVKKSWTTIAERGRSFTLLWRGQSKLKKNQLEVFQVNTIGARGWSQIGSILNKRVSCWWLNLIKLKIDSKMADKKRDKKFKQKSTVTSKVSESMMSSKFRFLNEQLYTTGSDEAVELFKEKELFENYH